MARDLIGEPHESSAATHQPIAVDDDDEKPVTLHQLPP